ncbi:hypothetical protein [Sphingomonas sanguinis]|jgi:hypothetical protein|uniref:Uncharacterized protein n=1 Tax=Sphingomonas sanguinis TaxID=33051 RepID=A0A7Y7QXF3_9SPHN|nr:hypothetical protein [Sphingomonas sanguinis]MBZ6383176.1 hypothetical protein [Sphingomonas sanguinis]NNG50037.1 hypothetical protein [Sphingomonas sanguinis]NNG53626.1 hypothetical protein [Sphingomonas sanguinis]NVP32472.1 hypothetical protein [Sphingomonas sanguinis]
MEKLWRRRSSPAPEITVWDCCDRLSAVDDRHRSDAIARRQPLVAVTKILASSVIPHVHSWVYASMVKSSLNVEEDVTEMAISVIDPMDHDKNAMDAAMFALGHIREQHKA